MAKVIRKELEQKLAALNGAEWDSMSESDAGLDEGSDRDEALQPPPLPLHAKKAKRKGKATPGASVVPVGPAGELSGVVYIGHIPHGFYEEAMNGFFKQFGDVIRVRISKSKKSGRCKGFAYVEFVSPEVAEIVAETMNGYFLFDKQLVCRVLRFEEIHPNLFDGAGIKFRKVNWHGLYRKKYNAERTPAKEKKHTMKLQKRDKLKKAQLAKLGIEYDFPGIVATINDAEGRKGPSQETESSNGSIEGVEVAKGGKKSKDSRAGVDTASKAVEKKRAETVASPPTKSKAVATPSAAKSPPPKSPAGPAVATKLKGGANVKTPKKGNAAATKAKGKDTVATMKAEGKDAAAAPTGAAVAAAGERGKSPGSGRKEGSKKDNRPTKPEPAAATSAAAVAAAGGRGKSPRSGRKEGSKKDNRPTKPEPAAATSAATSADVGSGGKKSKSPKRGGGGKKRPLEGAEAHDAGVARASPRSAGRSGKKMKRAKPAKA